MGDGKDTYFWEDQWVGENFLCSIFLHLYHLSSSKNCTTSNLLVRYETSMSFSFGFRRNLTNKEMTEVAPLLSLLEGCSFREGRRDIRVWNLNLSRGFSCKSMLSLLLDPALPKELVFDVVWRTKVPKKVRSLSGTSFLVGLISLIGEEFCLLCLFVACCVGRRRMILFIFFGIASLQGPCGAPSLRCSVLALLVYVASK